MDITWIRDLPLWAKVILIGFFVFLTFAVILHIKSKNPPSRGAERKLQRKRDDEVGRYE